MLSAGRTRGTTLGRRRAAPKELDAPGSATVSGLSLRPTWPSESSIYSPTAVLARRDAIVDEGMDVGWLLVTLLSSFKVELRF